MVRARVRLSMGYRIVVGLICGLAAVFGLGQMSRPMQLLRASHNGIDSIAARRREIMHRP